MLSRFELKQRLCALYPKYEWKVTEDHSVLQLRVSDRKTGVSTDLEVTPGIMSDSFHNPYLAVARTGAIVEDKLLHAITSRSNHHPDSNS